MAGGDVHPAGTPNPLPCLCAPPMPREAYWVFGSWVQPTGWVLVTVGVLVSVAAAALIVHRHHRGVPVAASAAVVIVAVYPAVVALAVAPALWMLQLTATTSAGLVLAVVLGVPAVVVAMRRRGDESPGRPGPALTPAAADPVSRKVP